MTMKNIIILIAAALLSLPVIAQQDAQFTHYMYNTIHVNPGYTGSRDMMTVGLLHRSQWIGLDGAPTSQTFYIHSPIGNKKMNLGFSMLNDKIGPVANTMFYGDFAYRTNVSANTRLAFGIKAGVNLFQPKLSTVQTDEANDQAFVNSNVNSTLAPNFGFGVYLDNDRYYLGASIPRLVEHSLETGDTTSIVEKRHIFLIGGLILPLNDMLKLKPTVQTKFVENAPGSIDLTLEAIAYDMISVGLGYRFNDAVNILAGVQITPQFKAGMSYDFTTSALRTANSGSLEFMLIYDFLFKEDKLKSPRYF